MICTHFIWFYSLRSRFTTTWPTGVVNISNTGNYANTPARCGGRRLCSFHTLPRSLRRNSFSPPSVFRSFRKTNILSASLYCTRRRKIAQPMQLRKTNFRKKESLHVNTSTPYTWKMVSVNVFCSHHLSWPARMDCPALCPAKPICFISFHPNLLFCLGELTIV